MDNLGFERMTPERTKALFAELGMTPQQRAYDNHGQTACCIIGALAYKYTGGRDGGFIGRDIMVATGLPMEYQSALIHGWDARDWDESVKRVKTELDECAPLSDEYRERAMAMHRIGYDDGRAGWKAVNAG